MSQQPWTDVDRYLIDALIGSDPMQEQTLEANRAAGLPEIDVAPNQGKLLYLIARLAGARRILEIGTLGGYSTIWLARALSADGRLITLEYNPKHAEVAAANIARCGLSDRVEIHTGPALESLPHLTGPFDLIFIDADKPNNAAYLEWALKLSRPGSAIICDNVVRSGAVIDPASADPGVIGTRRLLDALRADPRLDATAIQTVGMKGYDGFALAIVNG